jgi:hypothetical protein
MGGGHATALEARRERFTGQCDPLDRGGAWLLESDPSISLLVQARPIPSHGLVLVETDPWRSGPERSAPRIPVERTEFSVSPKRV